VAGASSASAWCRQPMRDVSSSYFEKWGITLVIWIQKRF
jgi:hypothetical protein